MWLTISTIKNMVWSNWNEPILMFLLEPLHPQRMGLHGHCKPKSSYVICIVFYLERQNADKANPKAQEAVDHLTSLSSGREEISQPGIEPPTSSLGFGYLSTNYMQSWKNPSLLDSSNLMWSPPIPLISNRIYCSGGDSDKIGKAWMDESAE